MAYQKKRTYKKKRYAKKKFYKKKYLPRRSITNKIYQFKRTFESSSITVAPAGFAQSVYSWSLGNLPNVTDFTNLFDMYRICGIKIRFVPVYDAALSSAINKFSIFTVIDYNDLNSITQAEAEEYQNMQQSYSTRVHKRYFKPRIAISQQDVSSTNFISSYKCPWISTQNTNIAHGFLKYVTDTNTGSAAFTFNVYSTLYVQFKNVK